MARGWLSPWISESLLTPDLLNETGYEYNLNWCQDDQPTKMRTRNGESLWSLPYPQELNDIPMIMHRQMDARDFADPNAAASECGSAFFAWQNFFRQHG